MFRVTVEGESIDTWQANLISRSTVFMLARGKIDGVIRRAGAFCQPDDLLLVGRKRIARALSLCGQ